MDLYHSRLTQDDLDDLIIKYKIPRDLHPRLPSEEFVMSELPDDAIGIYHRMFDFSGVRIPFSSFLLALIKHYKVHFSQLGPLGLNKTLCKQGDWFSFAKRRAPSPVCIDDNRSCMKHWKSGFFLIDRRAIPDAMAWRHPNATIDDPRLAAGSFSMADVRRLSAHVTKLRDMSEGVLVLSGLSHVWKIRICDSVLRGVDGNVMGIHDFLCLPEWTDAEAQEEPHLDVSSKILAKAEASQKRKASTSDATSSHVTKRTRSTLAQSSGSTTCPSLFVGDYDDESDGDDDACVEIPLVTPLRSAAVIPSSGNHGRSSTAPAVEGPNIRDSRGKGIMADDAAAPFVGVSRPRPSSSPVPSFRDVFGDAIHEDFFPFSAGPNYAIYPQDGIAGNCEFTHEEWDALYRPTFGVLTKEVFKDPAIYKTMVDQFPTPGEMVRVEALFEDQLTAKMSVLHCMMMSHGGELLARYRGLLQSHHEYVQSADSRLKGYEEKSKAKGKERKKKIKSLTKSLDNLHAEVAEKDEEILRLKTTPLEFSSFFRGQFQDLVHKFLTSDEFSRVQGELLSLADRLTEASLLVAQTDYAFLNKISKHATEPLSVILQLEPKKLARPANVPPSRDARVSPSIAKESTMTPASKSLELSANVDLTASAIASEHNKEMVNAEVDGSNLKMTDDTVATKSVHAFV
ncbi:hypothetical protein Tco_0698559 [Tanacetum coccineum]